MANKLLKEARSILFVVTERTKQREDSDAALTSNPGSAGDVLSGAVLNVKLHPFTAIRVNGSLHELMLRQVPETVALTRLKDDAWATNEL